MATKTEQRFLARDAEIQNLKILAAEAKQGHGRVLLLEGEPGMGKTRIMRELSHLVEGEGMMILFGRCYGKAVPYSAWLEIAYEYYRQASKEKLSKVLSGLPTEFSSIILPSERSASSDTGIGIRAWLKGTSPSVTESRSSSTSGEGSDRIRIFEGFLRFFTNISQDKPLVLLIDDLHVADVASVQLLRYMAGKVLARRIAIIGGYRDDQMRESEALSETVDDLKREGLCSIMRVEPLTLEETRELIESVIDSPISDPSLIQKIFRVSQGNPFFVQELASALVSKSPKSQLSATSLPWMSPVSAGLELPTSLRAVVKKKLVRLPPETVKVLSLASLMGQEFSFDLLKEVAQANEEDLLQQLEASAKDGVISEMPGTKQVLYRFNHTLIREVLVEELGTARKRHYHRAIAEAIEKSEGTGSERFLDMLALHYLEAGDEKKAVDFSLRAAARAERMLAYDEAIQDLSNALELCEIPDLRRHITDDIEILEKKRTGWRRFVEEEAFKVGTAGYDSIGEKYERLVVPAFEPIARPIFEISHAEKGQRVLDIGTGTGLLAFMMARAVGENGYVLGVDISQGMLSVARRKALEQGVRNLEFRLMDNTALQLPDGQFDLAVSSFGLPPFNADRAISEAYRILKKDGVFVFDEWVPSENKPGIIFEETLSKYRTPNPSERLVTIRDAASYRGRGFRKVWDGINALDWLKRAGFGRVETFKRSYEEHYPSVEEYFEYQAAWWTVDVELQEMDEQARRIFLEELKKALSPLMDRNGIPEKSEVTYFKAYKEVR